LIHTDWGPVAANYPSWRGWFEASGVNPGRKNIHGLTVNASRAALDLAENGLGIALGQGVYVAPLIAKGLLVIALDNAAQSLNHPYCLTVPEASLRKPVVALFRDWLAGKCLHSVEYLKA
jgi:LysR family glycine cleavage system transcriptional activator